MTAAEIENYRRGGEEAAGNDGKREIRLVSIRAVDLVRLCELAAKAVNEKE